MVKKDKIKFSEDEKEELGTQKKENHFFPIELFESLKNAWVI
jgi:hypothetical protein